MYIDHFHTHYHESSFFGAMHRRAGIVALSFFILSYSI